MCPAPSTSPSAQAHRPCRKARAVSTRRESALKPDELSSAEPLVGGRPTKSVRPAAGAEISPRGTDRVAAPNEAVTAPPHVLMLPRSASISPSEMSSGARWWRHRK
eukprot:scaffold4607_cov85-Isochrysis_galbana.AAC.1